MPERFIISCGLKMLSCRLLCFKEISVYSLEETEKSRKFTAMAV
jgi:hypothetical protein